MDWKGFLKPNWRKIIVFIIISVIIFLGLGFLGMIAFSGIHETIGPPTFEKDLFFVYFSIITLPAQIISTIFYPDYISKSSLEVVGWTLNLIYWYLLSCLIVWGWNKYRGKKK